jgi:riboflavin kinase/FMN adenylyltransferase
MIFSVELFNIGVYYNDKNLFMAELVYLNDVKRDPNTVLTVGTFDGVHAGHRVLMNTVLKKSKERNARSAIITFDPHPREIINPGNTGIQLLTTLKERREILEEIGIDLLVTIPFDRDFSLLSAQEFVRDVIYKQVGVSEFVIGYDHHFGRDRKGTIETVEELGDKLGFDAYVVSKQEVGEQTVSSTAIRKELQENGNVERVAEMLQRRYRLSGTVVHGDKRGKELGFPTANINPSEKRKIVPHNGIYAVKVRVDDTWINGVMSIGIRPTFKNTGRTIEVYLFDFDKPIYGMSVEIMFVKRLRDELKFESAEELVNQMKKDEMNARSVLKNE